jgi:diguanylate cyclase (GGDEF)-like protein
MVIEQDILWRMIDVSHAFARNLLMILSSRVRSDNQVILDSVGVLREFERHAVTDALTDLHNRHWLDNMFRRRLERCLKDETPASMVMVDVDQFKQFNDRYGHVAGDRALRLVAETLRSYSGPGDMVARFGGDEFCILLPGADVEAARGCAERARWAVLKATEQDAGAPRSPCPPGSRARRGRHPGDADRARRRRALPRQARRPEPGRRTRPGLPRRTRGLRPPGPGSRCRCA